MPDPSIVAFDLLALAVLVYGLYFRRHRRRDMVLGFVALNVGAMAITAMLSDLTVGTGLGLGLFGVLSIIRLRSSEIAHEEVAYYFIALALGLIAGFQPEPPGLVVVLGVLLVAATWVADHPRLGSRYRRQVVTLDAAYTDESQLRVVLEDLLGGDVCRVVVTDVDLVRDLTVVDVRFRLPVPGRRVEADEAGRGRPRTMALAESPNGIR